MRGERKEKRLGRAVEEGEKMRGEGAGGVSVEREGLLEN